MIKRKLLRFPLLVIPFLYYRYNRGLILGVLGSITLFLLLMDTIRLKKAGFNEWLFKKLPFLMKEGERNKVSGISWLFISLWAVVYFFEKEIAILAMVISILYDLFSATGKAFGRIKLGRRSLEGCLVGFIVAFGIGYIMKDILMLKVNVVFFASLTAVLTELFPTKIDDNLTIPFFTALVAQFVKNSF